MEHRVIIQYSSYLIFYVFIDQEIDPQCAQFLTFLHQVRTETFSRDTIDIKVIVNGQERPFTSFPLAVQDILTSAKLKLANENLGDFILDSEEEPEGLSRFPSPPESIIF